MSGYGVVPWGTGRWGTSGYGVGSWGVGTGGGAVQSAIGRWQPDTVEPIAQDTPTLYVKWDATGTGDGSSWDNAYTTLLAAYEAASNDDVISISGGESGHIYIESYIYIIKAITIQGSTEEGHNGAVKFNNGLYVDELIGTLTLNNFQVYIENYGSPCIQLKNDNTVHNNMVYGQNSAMSSTNQITKGNHTFNYCTFVRAGYRFDNIQYSLFYTSGIVDLGFNYCTFEQSSGIGTLLPGSSFSVNNCLILSQGRDESFINIGNSATTTVAISRTSFFGGHPVTSGENSVLTVDRCYWTKEPGISNVGGNSPYFDTSNKATITNTIAHVDPKFTTTKNTSIGQFFTRYDDRNNLDTCITVAQTLNPEIVLTSAVELHGRHTSTRPTAQNIDDMRTLIANGNEIMSHGADHTDNEDMGTINISATGTSPTLNIVATQTGDSTTWTNILTVTINSVSQEFDLISIYTRLVELVDALDETSIGDGIISCSISNSGNQAHSFVGTLENTSGQSISSTYEISHDRTAYNRYQITEAIADLTSYINGAMDRNGANPVTGTTVATPDPIYICKGYASPYGNGDSSIVTLLQSDPNIIHGTSAGDPNTVDDYYGRGENVNIYSHKYGQIEGSTQSEDLFSFAASASAGSFIHSCLYHSGTPLYNGSLENFKAMLISLGVGGQAMAEYFDYIRTDGAWTISEPNASFTGTADDYLSQGDFSLQYGSPLFYTE